MIFFLCLTGVFVLGFILIFRICREMKELYRVKSSRLRFSFSFFVKFGYKYCRIRVLGVRVGG